MNTGTTSMQGVPTTVSVSSAFLKKCMNDPDGKIAKENAERKAKEKRAQEEKAAKRREEKRQRKRRRLKDGQRKRQPKKQGQKWANIP